MRRIKFFSFSTVFPLQSAWSMEKYNWSNNYAHSSINVLLGLLLLRYLNYWISYSIINIREVHYVRTFSVLVLSAVYQKDKSLAKDFWNLISTKRSPKWHRYYSSTWKQKINVKFTPEMWYNTDIRYLKKCLTFLQLKISYRYILCFPLRTRYRRFSAKCISGAVELVSSMLFYNMINLRWIRLLCFKDYRYSTITYSNHFNSV